VTFPEISGISIGGATAIFGMMIATVAYVFRQWWEEAKRISALREQVYLRFGNKVGQLEACLVLRNDSGVHDTFAELSGMVVEFHLFASTNVQVAVGAYMYAMSKIISGDTALDPYSPTAGLNDPRNRVLDAMRTDVLWLSKPFFQVDRYKNNQVGQEKNTK
jgi:hypothetical protein